jgi:uncharacterized membrane protein
MEKKKQIWLKIGILFFGFLVLVGRRLCDKLTQNRGGWIYLVIACVSLVAVWILAAKLKQSHQEEDSSQQEDE